MTDKTMESSPSSGSAETPNPSASQQDVKPTSAFDANQLLKQVEVLIEKKVQSVKDRRFDEMDKRLGGAESVLERVKDLIPAEKFNELKKDLEFEDLKRRVYGEEPKPVAVASAAIDVAKVASEYGLKADDPEFVAAFASRKYTDEKDARLDLVTFAYKKATKPQPSDADAASAPSRPQAKQTLTEEGYKKEMLSAPRGKAGEAQRAEIKRKYAEGGISVHTIDLT